MGRYPHKHFSYDNAQGTAGYPRLIRKNQATSAEYQQFYLKNIRQQKTIRPNPNYTTNFIILIQNEKKVQGGTVRIITFSSFEMLSIKVLCFLFLSLKPQKVVKMTISKKVKIKAIVLYLFVSYFGRSGDFSILRKSYF